MNEVLGDNAEHRRVQEILPWFVANTLPAAECAACELHLAGCTACSAEADWLRQMLQSDPSLAAPRNQPDVERALARLLPRLEDNAMAAPQRTVRESAVGKLRRLLSANQRWLPWAFAVQWVAIAAMAALVSLPPDEPNPYRALGSADANDGDLVVTFRPETSVDEMRRILRASGTRIVDGPLVTNGYLLRIESGTPAQAAAVLRAQHAVTLAEQLALDK